MFVLGFSVNLLTLFGLILAIGIVVDDAIVIVENASHHIDHDHLPPKDSDHQGDERSQALGTAVFGAMIAATFLAVFFVPVFYVVIQRRNEWKSPQTSQSTEILTTTPDPEILTAGSHRAEPENWVRSVFRVGCVERLRRRTRQRRKVE